MAELPMQLLDDGCNQFSMFLTHPCMEIPLCSRRISIKRRSFCELAGGDEGVGWMRGWDQGVG